MNSKESYKSLAESLLNLSLKEIKARSESQSFKYRTVCENGEYKMISADHCVGRMNLTIDAEIVSRVDVEGLGITAIENSMYDVQL